MAIDVRARLSLRIATLVDTVRRTADTPRSLRAICTEEALSTSPRVREELRAAVLTFADAKAREVSFAVVVCCELCARSARVAKLRRLASAPDADMRVETARRDTAAALLDAAERATNRTRVAITVARLGETSTRTKLTCLVNCGELSDVTVRANVVRIVAKAVDPATTVLVIVICRRIVATAPFATCNVLTNDFASVGALALLAERVAFVVLDSATTLALASDLSACARRINTPRLGEAAMNVNRRALTVPSVAAEPLATENILVTTRASCVTLAPAAVRIAATRRIREPALAEVVVRTALIERESTATDACAAANVTNRALSAVIAATLLPAAERTIATTRTMEAELALLALRVERTPRVTTATFGEAAASASSRCLIDCRVAMFDNAQSNILMTCRAMLAEADEALLRVAATTRTSTAAPLAAAARLADTCRAMATRLGDAALSTIRRNLTACCVARFGEAATSNRETSLTRIAALDEAAASCLTTP